MFLLPFHSRLLTFLQDSHPYITRVRSSKYIVRVSNVQGCMSQKINVAYRFLHSWIMLPVISHDLCPTENNSSGIHHRLKRYDQILKLLHLRQMHVFYVSWCDWAGYGYTLGGFSVKNPKTPPLWFLLWTWVWNELIHWKGLGFHSESLIIPYNSW